MKKLLIILMILTLGTFLACGNDEGDSGVSLELTTEDGIENLGSIIEPTDPNMSLPGGPPFIQNIQILAYSNGVIQNSNLLMNKIIDSNVLLFKDYFSIDVPAGNKIIFLINAIDANKVIIYSGKAGPLNIRPRSVIPIAITLKKMISTPVQSLSKTLQLYDYNDLTAPYTNFSSTIGATYGITNADDNIKVNIYTQATKEDYGWVPTNPQGSTYTAGGSYNNTGSQWTGGSFLTDAFQLITVHVADDSGGVIAYGVRVYHSTYMNETPIAFYMRHPSKLVVALQSSSIPSGNHKVQMQVTVNSLTSWRDLNIVDTLSPLFNPTINNPIVVDAPSAQQWFSGAAVGSRNIRIMNNTSGLQWGSSSSVEVDWGVSKVIVTNP